MRYAPRDLARIPASPPWPVEDVWMQSRADRFRPIVSGERYLAYEVIGR
jgi:hypothetical protein